MKIARLCKSGNHNVALAQTDNLFEIENIIFKVFKTDQNDLQTDDYFTYDSYYTVIFLISVSLKITEMFKMIEDIRSRCIRAVCVYPTNERSHFPPVFIHSARAAANDILASHDRPMTNKNDNFGCPMKHVPVEIRIFVFFDRSSCNYYRWIASFLSILLYIYATIYITQYILQSIIIVIEIICWKNKVASWEKFCSNSFHSIIS